MDLYAYAQMEKLMDREKLADYFKIYRLRGIRFMKEEIYYSEEEIQKTVNETVMWKCRNVLEPNSWLGEDEMLRRTKRFIRFKTVMDSPTSAYEEPVAIRWENLHGKRRKEIKKLIKDTTKETRINFDMHNSYVGEDVLCIHTRTGGGNREYYDMATLKDRSPRYLSDCDDFFDGTYADIYFDISGLDMTQFMKAEEEAEKE